MPTKDPTPTDGAGGRNRIAGHVLDIVDPPGDRDEGPARLAYGNVTIDRYVVAADRSTQVRGVRDAQGLAERTRYATLLRGRGRAAFGGDGRARRARLHHAGTGHALAVEGASRAVGEPGGAHAGRRGRRVAPRRDAFVVVDARAADGDPRLAGARRPAIETVGAREMREVDVRIDRSGAEARFAELARGVDDAHGHRRAPRRGVDSALGGSLAALRPFPRPSPRPAH